MELHVVLEGDRNGLPVYCTSGPRFRIRGRAIPDRLVLTPAEAGLAAAEVGWVQIVPTAGAAGWRRTRIRGAVNRWSLPATDLNIGLDGLPPRTWGTARFSAAVNVGGGQVLGADGWDGNPGPNPENAPGFRVTRVSPASLPEAALGLAGLPVFPGAVAAHLRERVALRPVDLVLGAYAEMGGQPLPGPDSAPLDSPEWEWLFEPTLTDVTAREDRESHVMSAAARPVAWADSTADGAASERVRPGDVVIFDEAPTPLLRYAVLAGDDGDGWLGGADRVVHAASGTVTTGELHAHGTGRFRTLRPRSFATLRARLTEAGYRADPGVDHYGPDLGRALREFQRDQGLPADGIPDDVTREALARFLDALRSHDPASAPAADGP
ncbi:MAG: peptidoglycan-binding protein [Gemmatimonadetes bacterium]|nr:peptidoglycan-binding protein [Gemmatimonadota bacterium]